MLYKIPDKTSIQHAQLSAVWVDPLTMMRYQPVHTYNDPLPHLYMHNFTTGGMCTTEILYIAGGRCVCSCCCFVHSCWLVGWLVTMNPTVEMNPLVVIYPNSAQLIIIKQELVCSELVVVFVFSYIIIGWLVDRNINCTYSARVLRHQQPVHCVIFRLWGIFIAIVMLRLLNGWACGVHCHWLSWWMIPTDVGFCDWIPIPRPFGVWLGNPVRNLCAHSGKWCASNSIMCLGWSAGVDPITVIYTTQ